MPLRETTIARLGLVALAIALWKSAAALVFEGLLPRYPTAVVLLAVTYVASFVCLLVASSTSAKATRIAGASLGALAAITTVVVFRDAVAKASSEWMPTNDGHVFMDVAARYLLGGKNPYAQGLADAFRVYRMPLSYATPLVDGDFSDRQAYPALSFLVLVPAVLAHVPTYLVYAAAFVAAVAIVVIKAPWWARPIVVAAFTLEDTYFAFAFGGVTDTVWVLLLVGAIVCWRRRPTWAAVLIGLACAYKQHPWFLVPLLLVRLGHDHGEPPWGRAARRFVAIVAAVFVAVNLPFVVWGPRIWIAGITEPLVAPMVQLSEGLTAFSMTGWISMPRAGSSAIFWGLYALALFTYARHTRVLREWCWVVPGVVLWFGYRALMSYWYFFALLALAAMVMGLGEGDESAEPAEREAAAMKDRSWRPTVIAACVLAAGIGGFMVWCALRPAPFRMTLVETVETWERRAFLLHVRLENRRDRALRPQFSLQSNSMQPLGWLIVRGPDEVLPGQSAEYTIRAPRVFAEYDVTEDARLSVHNRLEPGHRAFLTVPGERSLKMLDAIPNPAFTVVETRTQVPSGWTFESSNRDAKLTLAKTREARARLTFDFAAETPAVQSTPDFAVCVVGQHLAEVAPGTRKALLSTVLPLPETPFTLDVNVPPSANRPPWDELYGVMLAVPDFRAVVLFGDDVPRGTLPSGEVFTSLPVPRGEWSTATLSPRALLERLQAPLHQVRYKYLRAPTLDFPSVPVELGLLATAPAGKQISVQLGRITQTVTRPTQQLFDHSSPAGLAAWRADLDLENGNYEKAVKQLEIATTLEPTVARLLHLADAYFLSKDFVRARDTYARLLAGGDLLEAEKGIGLSMVELGDLDGAFAHLTKARDRYVEIEKTPPRWHYLATLRGLATVHAKRNDCATALRYRDEIAREAPSLTAPALGTCE